MDNINKFNYNDLAVTKECDSLINPISRLKCTNKASWILRLPNESFTILCNPHKIEWELHNKLFEKVEYIPFSIELANKMQDRIKELYG